MKLPALQFYPGDWKRDAGVQSLSIHDRGVWFECLLLMHDSAERGVLLINGKPPTVAALARILGLSAEELTESLKAIEAAGVSSLREDGAIFSRRMVRDEEIRLKRVKAGLKGGNPNLLKQNPTKTENEGKPLSNQIPEDEDEDEDETEDLDLKKTVSLPNPLKWSAEELATLERWRAYQATKGNDLDQIQLEAIFSAWNYDRPGFMRAANYAIANRHKNLNPQPDPKDRAGPPKVIDYDEELRKKKREELRKWAAQEESQEAK